MVVPVLMGLGKLIPARFRASFLRPYAYVHTHRQQRRKQTFYRVRRRTLPLVSLSMLRLPWITIVCTCSYTQQHLFPNKEHLRTLLLKHIIKRTRRVASRDLRDDAVTVGCYWTLSCPRAVEIHLPGFKVWKRCSTIIQEARNSM